MKDFLLTIILEGIEDKYEVRLSRGDPPPPPSPQPLPHSLSLYCLVECKIMKNRKFLGSLSEQSVRKKSKPFIVEMDNKQ